MERSYQLPGGPQAGRPAQRDQMVAAAVSRWEGEAGRGHGRPWEWRQEVREAEQGLVRGGREWRTAQETERVLEKWKKK